MLSFQIAPENTDDALVYSGYYLARVSDGVSLMLQATKQDSNISTLGGAAVAGTRRNRRPAGAVDLPTTPNFYQNFTFGIDYKNLDEDIVVGKDVISSPIEYYPLSANYGANWMADKSFTALNASLNFSLRGIGGEDDYANKRYNADGSYVYLRSDLAHTRDLAGGSQVLGKSRASFPASRSSTASNIAGGGLDTVRGYLEATALGDNGFFGTVELRSPSLIGDPQVRRHGGSQGDEWRFHAFADAGMVGLLDALPGQESHFSLASFGVGSRVNAPQALQRARSMSPFRSSNKPTPTDGEVRVTFRGWADF